MPVVLVHGVPEPPAVWGQLQTQLARKDVITLQLPGFGCARPDGFGATKEEYVSWLTAELQGLQGGDPIDLVGHDWGGGLLVRLVSTRPDLVRSWVTDAAGLGDPEFEWHDFAKIWQTPGEGEDFFAQQLAQSVEERATVFEMVGVPHDDATAMAGSIDQTMVDCILALYRSAMDVGKEWAPDFQDIPAAGLVLLPSEDPFLSVDRATAGAKRAGASVAELSGLSHWWMLQDPAQGAAVLEGFWATVS